jgi:hypothetical protein
VRTETSNLVAQVENVCRVISNCRLAKSKKWCDVLGTTTSVDFKNRFAVTPIAPSYPDTSEYFPCRETKLLICKASSREERVTDDGKMRLLQRVMRANLFLTSTVTLVRDFSARFVLLGYGKLLSQRSPPRPADSVPDGQTLKVLCNSPAYDLLKDLFFVMITRLSLPERFSFHSVVLVVVIPSIKICLAC